MKGFSGILTATEIEQVADFVRQEFMVEKKPNTRYHTVENGWPDHDRYAVAFPFATGELPIDADQGALTPEQRQGLTLFLSTCISCHDRARVEDEGPIWEPRAVSYPRRHFNHRDPAPPDALSGATPYARHDIPPQLADLSPKEQKGESLFQGNCAFCHAADGSGMNWIGMFLEPHPRNLTDPDFWGGADRERLLTAISHGLAGSSMPAWKDVLSAGEIDAVIAYLYRAFAPAAATKRETPPPN